MALITEGEIRARGNDKVVKFSRSAGAVKKASDVITRKFSEQVTNQAKTYDIFLSHAFADQILIVGLTDYLNSLNYSIYVDWLEDSQLNRSQVTKETARTIRSRMDKCSCLLFATTVAATKSIWMPWELGYFDGKKGRAAILPLAQTSANDQYVGQEYLGMYPYVVRTPTGGGDTLYTHNSIDKYVNFDRWLLGVDPPL